MEKMKEEFRGCSLENILASRENKKKLRISKRHEETKNKT